MNNSISIEPILLYLSAIFWTLGYDTIYGLQDVKDDEIIGVKSTSIKFKKNVKNFVSICYSFCILLILTLSFKIDVNYFFYVFLILIITQFIFQIKNFKEKDSNSCLKVFKSNNYIGILMILTLATLNI